MKKNLKWLINVATICLCLCAMVIGIYAAKQASLTATGTIGFTATNVYAEVSGQTSGAAEEVTFNTITIDSTKTGNPYTDTTTWSGKNIDFNEEGTPITLTFTITNLSTGRPLYAKVTNTSSATNLNVQVDGEDFSATEWLELPAKTEGSTANTTTVVISLSVADDNESVTGNYGFNIELQSTEPEVVNPEMENALTISEWNSKTDGTALGFDIKDGKAYVKQISSEKTYGAIVVPAYVKDNSDSSITYPVVGLSYDGAEPTNQMFYHNAEITSIVLPTTFEDLNSTITNTTLASAFENCTKLEQVTILNGTGQLYANFFKGCTNLKSIVIPAGITSIYMWAFSGCSNLTDVYFMGTQDQWNSIEINSSGNDALINASVTYDYKVA